MELYEQRIVNGVLKALPGLGEPKEILRLLSRDLEIIVDPARAHIRDLWPAIWSLASVLSRQFQGKVFIRGMTEPEAAPAPLDSCVFAAAPRVNVFRIGLGVALDLDDPSTLGWGDVRGACVTHRALIPTSESAHPISAFALSGYLGFMALATIIGIPPSRADYVTTGLTLPFSPSDRLMFPDDGLTFIGLGQLGQAYLALLFFLLQQGARPRITLLDRDSFESGNRATQILLDARCDWLDAEKAKFLERHFNVQGWHATGEVTELVWGWERPERHPRLAMLGLDAFDPRRMAIEAGYDWLVEAGVGTSFLDPLVTWHSVPPNRVLAASIFVRNRPPEPEADGIDFPFFRSLRDSVGGCGWVTFQNVQAAAPSMGLVASAYAWAEMVRVMAGQRTAIAGCARLWSPLLPYSRADIKDLL
jgi:hypothetical protein